MRPVLSARQEECLRLTAFRTDREIAVVLGISEATVKKHVHEACQRLSVKRRKAALALLSGAGDPILNPAASPRDVTTRPTARDETCAATNAPTPGQIRSPSGSKAGGQAMDQRTTQPRLGYLPPPANPVARLAMIVGLSVVMVAATTTVTTMVGDYHLVLGRLIPDIAPDGPVLARAGH